MNDPREETHDDPALAEEVRRHLLDGTARGPRYGRWVAVGLSCVLMGGGIWVAMRPASVTSDADSDRRLELRKERQAALRAGDWDALRTSVAGLLSLGAVEESLSREASAVDAWARHVAARESLDWEGAVHALGEAADRLGAGHPLAPHVLAAMRNVEEEVAARDACEEAERAAACGDWEGAERCADAVVTGSAYAGRASTVRAAVREGRWAQALEGASETARAGRWGEAMAALDAAELTLGEDPRAGALRTRWEAEEDAEERLAAARECYRESPARARDLLEGIGPGSVFAGDVERAQRDVSAWEELDARLGGVRSAYRGGDAVGAIAGIESILEEGRLEGEGLAYVLALRERVRRVSEAIDEALRILDRGDDREGPFRLLQSVLAWEPDASNAFHRDAAEALALWERERDGVLADGLTLLNQALADGDWESARRLADELPGGGEHPLVRSARQALEEQARRLYEQGYVLRGVDPARAAELWEEAARCADPTGDLAARLSRQRARLAAAGEGS